MIVMKKTYLTVVLMVITALSIWSIALDFSRFATLDFTYDIFPSGALKRINVILAVLIAWAVGKDSLNPRDSMLIKTAMLFACLGEAAFALRVIVPGLFLFAVCQILLIIRNSTGLKNKLPLAGGRQCLLLMVSGLPFSLALAAMLFTGDYLFKVESVIIYACLYGLLLSASLWAGLASNILGLLPERNSRMAAAGIVCFYCCDILVGLDAALEPGLPWLLSNSFIWVFYIPALVLLSLSSYRYNL